MTRVSKHAMSGSAPLTEQVEDVFPTQRTGSELQALERRFKELEILTAQDLNQAFADVFATLSESRKVPALEYGYGLYRPIGSEDSVNSFKKEPNCVRIEAMYLALPNGRVLNGVDICFPLAEQHTQTQLWIELKPPHRVILGPAIAGTALPLLEIGSDGALHWAIGAVSLDATDELKKASNTLFRAVEPHRAALAVIYPGVAGLFSALRQRRLLGPLLEELACCLASLGRRQPRLPLPAQPDPVRKVCRYFGTLAEELKRIFQADITQPLSWVNMGAGALPGTSRYHVDLSSANWIGTSITLGLPIARTVFRYCFCQTPDNTPHVWENPPSNRGLGPLESTELRIPDDKRILLIETNLDPVRISIR